ncbi:unnamed protein product [Closterium sp. NIES-64]|nr:unnamed protein product [Closterium sp. NIES-64]
MDDLVTQLAAYDRAMREYQVALADWLAQRRVLRRVLVEKERREAREREGRRKGREQRWGWLAAWWHGMADTAARLASSRFHMLLSLLFLVSLLCLLFPPLPPPPPLPPLSPLPPLPPPYSLSPRRIKREKVLDGMMPARPLAPAAPQGVYLHGSVGSGKTMLMDMLFGAVQRGGVVGVAKRVHFNEAMLEVHQRMHRWDEEEEEEEGEDAILDAVADEFLGKWGGEGTVEHQRVEEEEEGAVMQGAAAVQGATAAQGSAAAAAAAVQGAAVLCFDEVQVLDVFTAVALGRLLQRVLLRGVVLVATSNKAPWELNQDRLQRELFQAFVSTDGLQRELFQAFVSTDGLQRELFQAFVSTVKGSCHVLPLSSPTDYRCLHSAPPPPAHNLPGPPPAPSSTPTTTTVTPSLSSLSPSQPHLSSPPPPHSPPPSPPTPPHLPSSRTPTPSHQPAPTTPLVPAFPGYSYFWPLGPQSESLFEDRWHDAVGRELRLHGGRRGEGGKGTDAYVEGQGEDIPVMFGRSLRVPVSVHGIARFSFSELCANMLGPPDYLALALRYHTLFLSEIPILSRSVHDQARRFLTLTDELYNHRCLLVCSAATAPNKLFKGLPGRVGSGGVMVVPAASCRFLPALPAAFSFSSLLPLSPPSFLFLLPPSSFSSLLHLSPPPSLPPPSLQFESEVGGSRLRRDVLAEGGRSALTSSFTLPVRQLSGREEEFAFHRAVSARHACNELSFESTQKLYSFHRAVSARHGMRFFLLPLSLSLRSTRPLLSQRPAFRSKRGVGIPPSSKVYRGGLSGVCTPFSFPPFLLFLLAPSVSALTSTQKSAQYNVTRRLFYTKKFNCLEVA